MKLTKSTIVKLIKEELQGLQEQSKGALRKQVNAACWPKGYRRGALTALRKSKACPGGMSYADYVKARKAARKGDAATVNALTKKTHDPRNISTVKGAEGAIDRQWKDDQKISGIYQSQRLWEKFANMSSDIKSARFLQKIGRLLARAKKRTPKQYWKDNYMIAELEKFVFGKEMRNWIAKFKKKNPYYEPFPGYGKQASGAASPSRSQRLKEPFSKRKHNRCVLDAWMKLKRKDKNIRMQDVFEDPKYKSIRDKCDAATGDTSGVAAKEGTP